MAATFLRYGLNWPANTDPLAIEFHMIRTAPPESRAVHYLSAARLLWPEDEQHRWFVLGMKTLVENKISVFLGCASSGKTHTMSCHALITFFANPRNSLALISSTEKRSLEIKVWGRVKELFNRAKRKYDYLPGYVLESQMAIAPDDISEDNETARLLNQGIVCVPCVSGGRFVGMGKFQGAKPPHTPGKFDGILTHYGDEAALMQMAFLDAYSNWTVSPGFKGAMAGNPTDISDPLCVAAEPVGGWDVFVDNGKTQEWTSQWYGAHVVAFDGRDTPNNDRPDKFYPYLLSSEWVESLKKTHGEDSWQLYQQGIGKPSRGMVSNRVITIGMCERNKAFEAPIFKDASFIDIYALDPAFGGGDRCVGGRLRIGLMLDGTQILEVFQPEIIPVRINASHEPEDQIAEHVFRQMEDFQIPAQNGFYDSFGRGTLGNALAKLFGSTCPIPVDSGARPTTRPVRFDLFVDDKNLGKRLKRCDEHYSKFITEMWHSVRETIESQQMRNLPRNVADEGQLRLFKIVAGNRIEVETKDEMKERIRKSPDLFDWLAVGVEGARRLGFKIKRIGQQVEVKRKPDWLDGRLAEQKQLRESRQLKTA